MPSRSTPDIPANAAPESASSILQTSPEQAEAFAEHVTLVRGQGDALGAIPAFRQRLIGLKSTAAAAIYVPATVEAANTLTATGVLGIMVACGSVAYLNYRGLNAKMQQGSEKFSPSTLYTLGQYYELFSRPSPDPKADKPILSLRWRGRIETDWNRSAYEAQGMSLLDSALHDIKKMAHLAHANGIDEFIVGYNLASEFVPPGTLPPVTTRCILEAKGIHPNPGNFLESNMVAAPKFWIDLKPEKRLPSNISEKTALIEVLRTVQPNHPAVVAYDSCKDAPWEQEKCMLRAVNVALNREYSEGHAQATSRKDDIIDSRVITAAKDRAYHEAWLSPDGKGLVWQSKGFTVAQASMKSVLGFDEKELTHLLQSPQHNAKEAAKVAIALLAEVLKNKAPNPAIRKLLGIGGEAEVQEPLNSLSRFPSEAIVEKLAPSYKDRFGGIDYVNDKPVRRQLIKKVLAGLACAVALLGVSKATFETMDEAYLGEVQKARTELISEGATPTADRVRERAAENSPIAGVWGEWKVLQYAIDSITPGFGLQGDAGSGRGGLQTGAGQDKVANVKDGGSPTADWVLETSGAISPKGYWTVATLSSLVADKEGIRWNRTMEIPSQDETVYDLPPTIAAAVSTGRPFIQVQRELKPQDYIPGLSLVRVPVREGTLIAAANIDGQPVSLDIQYDGTQFLQIDGAKSGKLHYWLVEDEYAPKPHATQPLRLDGTEITSGQAENIQRTWNAVIPGFSDMSPDEQLQQLHTYFQEQVTYDLSPFPESFNGDARDLVAYSAAAITWKEAQCNLAFTLTALNYLDPHNDEVIINGASGYYNFGDQTDHALTSGEAHMYGVEPDGAIVDNTPSSTEAQRSGESNGFSDLLPYGIGLLGLSAIGAGVLYRRRLRAHYHWTVRQGKKLYNRVDQYYAQKAQDQLRLQDPRVLSAAVKVTDVLRYQDPSVVHEGVQKALDDALRQPAHPLDAMHKLGQPHVHGKHTSWLLKKYAQVAVDPVHQDATRKISAVVRQARRASKHNPNRKRRIV